MATAPSYKPGHTGGRGSWLKSQSGTLHLCPHHMGGLEQSRKASLSFKCFMCKNGASTSDLRHEVRGKTEMMCDTS